MKRLATAALCGLLSASCADCGDPEGLASLEGVWDFTWTVEEATGACAGEVGQVSTGTIEIESGGESGAFDLSGFGEDDATMTGELDGNTLTFSGSFSDDQGTTTSSTTLELSEDRNALTGTEEWSWESPGNPGACPSATSSVEAERADDG